MLTNMLKERFNKCGFECEGSDEDVLAIAAKLERVARAAKILEADYHCFDNSLPDVWDELETALADLGALGG